MPPCLPNCFCDACLPQRLRTLEGSTLSEQRAFWERAFAGAPARLQPNQLQPRPSQPPNEQAPRFPFWHSQPPPPPPPSCTSLPRLDEMAALFSSGGEGVQPAGSATRHANLFPLSSGVASCVDHLEDALKIICNRLESTGPRRRQSMLEAMEGVIDFYENLTEHLLEDNNSTPSPPTNVAHLPIKIFSSFVASDTDRKVCTICQEDFENGEELVVLPCSHEFHNSSDCFKRWAEAGNKVCVNCRFPFAQDVGPR